MAAETADFLLSRPEWVTALAPWCRRYDELELCVLMLTQPSAGGGQRCAELERQLHVLSQRLPLGPVYFQRVKRAVAQLEDHGAVRGSGAPRCRCYSITPQGLAGLVLNLQVVEQDPTLDGSELELKRALVSMWSLLLRQLGSLPDAAQEPEPASFYAEAEALAVLGRPVLSEEVVAAALDPLQPIRAARRLVEARLAALRAQLAAPRAMRLDRRRLAPSDLVAATARALVRETFDHHELRVAEQRYEHYLRYLESLAGLIAAELPTVELSSVRELLGARR